MFGAASKHTTHRCARPVALLLPATFSLSWGSLTFVIPSEVLATEVRATGLAAGMLLNWACDYFVVATFLTLKTALGPPAVMALYAGVCALAAAFVRRFVPETKGTSLEGRSAL